jgi:hypothetical protein
MKYFLISFDPNENTLTLNKSLCDSQKIIYGTENLYCSQCKVVSMSSHSFDFNIKSVKWKILVAQNGLEVLGSNEIEDNDGIQCLLADAKHNLLFVWFEVLASSLCWRSFWSSSKKHSA